MPQCPCRRCEPRRVADLYVVNMNAPNEFWMSNGGVYGWVFRFRGA